MSKDKARILFWDIESRGLVGDYGSILCIGWQFDDEKKPSVISIHDKPGRHPLDDKEMIKWFINNVWNEADIAVGWYSGGHDEPFLRTRAIIHGLPAPKPVTTLDLWGKVWKRFKFSKNSLHNVSQHLGLPPKIWSEAEDFERVLYGHKGAMKRIVIHCRRDVETTVAAYKKFAPYINAHPRVTHDLGRCRICGGKKLQLRGNYFSAAKGRAKRVQCMNPDCLGWDTRRLKELE